MGSPEQTAAGPRAKPAPEFPVLAGMDPAERAALLARLPSRDYTGGETVLAEGEANDRLLLVAAGELVVLRGSGAGDFVLARLGPGECFGEMSALTGARTTATLRAARAATVLALRPEDLPAERRADVALNVAKVVIRRLDGTLAALQRKHEEAAAAMRTQLEAAVFVSKLLTGLALYVLLLPLGLVLKPYLPTDSLISFFFIAAFFGLAWVFVTRVGGGFAGYGMLPGSWLRESGRGLLFAVPVLALALAGKFWLVRTGAAAAVFEPGLVLAQMPAAHLGHWLALCAGYVALSYAQEFIRCATQGTLAAYFRAGGLHDGWKSIAVSSIVFAAMHVHLSPGFAAMALAAGVFWGWVYQRERSYWSVSAAHAATGAWAIFIVGVPY